MVSRSFDSITKVLLDEAGVEVVAWLAGERPIVAEPVPSELVETEARIADRIFRVILPREAPRAHYFHIEIQSRGDRGMALRMLDYWVKAKRRFRTGGYSPRVSSFVLYLTPRRYEPDAGELKEEDGFGTGCSFSYRVVKLWELDPASVLGLGSPALAPLAPLMRSANPASLVLESKKKILEADPREVPARKKAELCAVLGLLAGLVLPDKELIYKMISEDWMGLEDSVVVQDWIRRGMKKGIQKGIKKGIEQSRRSDLLLFLRSRFGRVGRKLEVRIRGVKDPRLLKKLIAKAAVARSLAEFSKALPEAAGD